MDQFLESHDGTKLRYKVNGKGEPLLLIHGVGSNLESWDEIAAVLNADFTVIRADLRGHGKSGRITDCAMEDFLRDCDRLANRLGFAALNVAGFSLGGLIAQHLAVSMPALVRQLVLISTVAERTDDERKLVLAGLKKLETEGLSGVVKNAQERWFTPEFSARYPEKIERRVQSLLDNDPESYKSAYRVFATADAEASFESIRCPTLIITGENDPRSNTRMARLLHKRIRGSALKIIPEKRHNLLLECPDELSDLLRQFLQ